MNFLPISEQSVNFDQLMVNKISVSTSTQIWFYDIRTRDLVPFINEPQPRTQGPLYVILR